MEEHRTHPLDLELDQYLLGTLSDPDGAITAHLRSCEHCNQRLAQFSKGYQGFLERFPTMDELSKEIKDSQRAPIKTSGLGPSSFARIWKWAVPIGAVAALLLIAVWLGHQKFSSRSKDPNIRIKGGSSAQIMIQRHGQTELYRDQVLFPGDILTFQYSTESSYLMILSMESTGRVQVLFSSPDGKSHKVQPGQLVSLGVGIQLDDYVGVERLVALFSDIPFQADQIQKTFQEYFQSLDPKKKASLDISDLSLQGELVSWPLRKQAKP